jgi:hypothetical protein
MKPLLLPHLIMVIVFGAICGGAGWNQAARSDEARCGDPSSGYLREGTERPEECRLLRQFPDIARRDGDALFITRSDGFEVVYEDHSLACAAHDATHCILHQAYAFDRQRNVLVILNMHYEWVDYDLVHLGWGDTITVPEYPHAAPAKRPFWAIVHAGETSPGGDIQIVTLEEEGFRILGSVHHPQCRFDRWDAELAFFVICWAPEDRRGEYRIVPGPDGTLQLSRTSRTVSEEEFDAFVPAP